MSSVAFIGLGNMGAPMAKNLLAAGHEVTVFDLVPAACADLQQAGAAVADSASAAARGKDYVISMLPAGIYTMVLKTTNGVLHRKFIKR